MAITWIDGFDLYDNTNMRPGESGRYVETVSDSSSVQSGRISGQAIRFDQNNGSTTRFSGGLGSGSDTVTVGFALQLSGSAIALSERRLMYFLNSGTIICTLSITSSGTLKFYRGDLSTQLVTSAAGVITANAYYHIEVALTRHASAGIVEIRVNGATVASGSGLNTGASSIDTLGFCQVQNLSSSDACFYDDLFVKNDVSSFLGDCRVETLRPTAETADQDWTPSTGTNNAAMVDDTTTDHDSTYVSAATATDKDVYTMGDLSDTPASIHAVQATMVAKKDDAGSRTVAASVKVNSAVDGATHTMGTSYQSFVDIVSVDPDTTAAWTAAGVNAAEFQLEVIT